MLLKACGVPNGSVSLVLSKQRVIPKSSPLSLQQIYLATWRLEQTTVPAKAAATLQFP